MSEHRVEKDSMGEVKVPARAYYASQTQRAVENFPISGLPLPTALIRALGLVKIAAATAECLYLHPLVVLQAGVVNRMEGSDWIRNGSL